MQQQDEILNYNQADNNQFNQQNYYNELSNNCDQNAQSQYGILNETRIDNNQFIDQQNDLNEQYSNNLQNAQSQNDELNNL